MSETTVTPEPHEKLSVFLGDWHAAGTSYGEERQTPDDPHTDATPWSSINSAARSNSWAFASQPAVAVGLLGDASGDLSAPGVLE